LGKKYRGKKAKGKKKKGTVKLRRQRRAKRDEQHESKSELARKVVWKRGDKNEKKFVEGRKRGRGSRRREKILFSGESGASKNMGLLQGIEATTGISEKESFRDCEQKHTKQQNTQKPPRTPSTPQKKNTQTKTPSPPPPNQQKTPPPPPNPPNTPTPPSPPEHPFQEKGNGNKRGTKMENGREGLQKKIIRDVGVALVCRVPSRGVGAKSEILQGNEEKRIDFKGVQAIGRIKRRTRRQGEKKWKQSDHRKHKTCRN